MNFFQRIAARMLGYNSMGTVSGMPDRAPQMIDNPFALPPVALDFPNAYRKVGIIRACIDRVSEDASGLPVLFETESRGEFRPIVRTAGNVVDVWNSANPQQTGVELTRDLFAYRLISGNAYLVMETFGTSRVQELWTLPSHLVEPVPGANRTERGFVFNRGGRREFIPAEFVIQWRAFNPDDEPVGSGELESVQHAYENRYDSGRLRQKMLRSGGMANGFFRLAGSDKREVNPLGPVDRKAAIEALTKMYGGIDNMGRARILDVWEFVQTGMTVDQLKLLESDSANDAEICRSLGVPPWLVGIKEGNALSTGSQIDERLYWQNRIKPLVEFRDRLLTERLCPRFGTGIRMRTDFSGVLALQQPVLNAAQQLVALTGRPVMTTNEMRKTLGLPPIADPSADELYEKPAAMPFGLPGADVPADAGAAAPAASDGKPAAASKSGSRMIDGDAVREERRKAASVNVRRFERRLERAFADLLDGQRARVVSQLEAMQSRGRAVRSIDPEEVFVVTESEREQIMRILSALISERGEDAIAELALAVEVTLTNERAAKFVLSQAQRVLTLTEATTRQALREVIASSVEAGESLSALVERINVMPEFTLTRAQTIARTESISAYNFATRDAWEQSGVVEEVEWLSARDGAVRESHADADGQTASSIGGVFDVGGSTLRFPGDPLGSPDETINCRCTLLPVVTNQRKRGLAHLFGKPSRRTLAALFHKNGVAK